MKTEALIILKKVQVYKEAKTYMMWEIAPKMPSLAGR